MADETVKLHTMVRVCGSPLLSFEIPTVWAPNEDDDMTTLYFIAVAHAAILKRRQQESITTTSGDSGSDSRRIEWTSLGATLGEWWSPEPIHQLRGEQVQKRIFATSDVVSGLYCCPAITNMTAPARRLGGAASSAPEPVFRRPCLRTTLVFGPPYPFGLFFLVFFFP